MSSISTTNLLQKFKNNYKLYKEKEIGDGTQDFCKNVFESEVFGLASGDTAQSGKFRYEAMRSSEGHRGDDFILNINGIIVPVEVEKLNNIQAGESQIADYMKRKNTLYGILTDGGIWKFYTQGYSAGPTKTLTISDLLSEQGKTEIQRLFLKKDYYLNSFGSLSALVSQSEFVLEDFHQDLIKLAEDVKSDFQNAGAFGINDIEPSKIKGVYSFIIQFILLKIIQDKKKNLDLLGIEKVKTFLENEDWNHLTKHIFQKLRWLGDFYGSYKNEQDLLLQKIRERYTDDDFPEYNIDALRPFLDLYVFVLKYNFSKVKQDIFGAVYENYLKELYKDDDTKKGQVFTPPDIVEFMLDEVGYTEKYIYDIISEYGMSKIQENLASLNIETQYFNILGLSIIDPACGSGTFLYKAASRIVNAIHRLSLSPKEKGLLAESLIINNIVGFDIEAFPLYLAEMNILMALLFHNIDDTTGDVLNKIDRQIRVFSTKDSIAEFANSDTSLKESIIHALDEQLSFTNTIDEKRDESEIFKIYLDIRDIDRVHIKEDIKCYYVLRKIITDLGEKNPIVSELSKKKNLVEYEKTLLQENHKDDANTKLQRIKIAAEYKKYKTDFPRIDTKVDELILKHETKRTKFDFIVGNPPYIKQVAAYDSKNLFGININLPIYAQMNIAGKSVKIGNSSQNLYVYFYYLAYYLMQNGGKLCFITPRSLIQQPATHKLRQFLKIHTNIKSIYDFGNGSLFYKRGLNSNISVATDSCILKIKKEEADFDTDYVEYIGEPGNIELKNFIENQSTKVINKNDLFSFENKFTFFEYFNQLKDIDPDFHYSIYTGIFLSKNDDRSNDENRGLPILYPTGYYFGRENIANYYDINDGVKISTSGRMEFPTTRDIIAKKYKISWGGRFSSKTKKYFTFSDIVSIQDWDRYTSIGVNKESNLGELYFLFGVLNSEHITLEISKNFGGVCNMTNLRQLPFPKLNSDKNILKNQLIENSKNIIQFAKQLQSLKNWRDILDIGLDGLDETIRGIKMGYEYMQEKIGDIQTIEKGAPIPKEMLKWIRENNPHMKQLEAERDEIVEKLYSA